MVDRTELDVKIWMYYLNESFVFEGARAVEKCWTKKLNQGFMSKGSLGKMKKLSTCIKMGVY